MRVLQKDAITGDHISDDPNKVLVSSTNPRESGGHISHLAMAADLLRIKIWLLCFKGVLMCIGEAIRPEIS